MRAEKIGWLISGLSALTLSIVLWRRSEREAKEPNSPRTSSKSTALLLGIVSIVSFLAATPTFLGNSVANTADRLGAGSEARENIQDVLGSIYFVVMYSIVSLVFVTRSIITRDWDDLKGWLMLTGIIVTFVLILTAFGALTKTLDDIINLYKDVLSFFLP